MGGETTDEGGGDFGVVGSNGKVTVGIKSRRRALEESLYGVLFTLAKEKLARKAWFAIFLVIIDFLQLLAFAFVDGIPWVLPDVHLLDEVFHYLKFVQLQYALSDLGYIAYTVAVGALSLMQVFCLSVSGLIAYYFRQNHFPVVWPIRVARVFIGLFLSSFYISSLQIFLISMDCVFLNQEQALLESFPTIPCWEFPNAFVEKLTRSISHQMSISLVMTILFFGAALLIQLVQFDPSPRTPELLGSPEAKIEIRNFLIKTLLTIVTVILSSYGIVQAIALLLASSFFLYNGIVSFPMYSSKMNIFRNSLYSALWFAALTSVLVFLWNTEEQIDERKIMTYMMLSGIAPAAALGGALSYVRGRSISRYSKCQKWVVLKKDVDALKESLSSVGVRELDKKMLTGPQAKQIHRLTEKEMMDTPEDEIALLTIFPSPSHVERATRFVLENPLEPARIRLGMLIYLEGIRQFPDSAFLHLAFCDYLQAYTQQQEEALSYLELARQKKPKFYDRFNIFVHDRQRLQEQHASASGTSAMDLVTYVDFKNKYHQALSVHRKVLKVQRQFWKLVLTKKISHGVISSYIQKIGSLERKATDTYAQLLERYSGSAKVLRTYARFLAEIKHEHVSSEKVANEADRIEEADALARRQTFMDGVKASKRIDAFEVEGEDADSVVLASFSMLREDRDPICVLKLDGKIEFVNDVMAKLLGYTRRGELAGRNINMLIPAPFSGRPHEQMVENILLDDQKQAETFGKVKGSYVRVKDGGLMPVVMAFNRYQSMGAVRIFFTLKEDKQHKEGEGLIVLGREGKIVDMDKNILNYMDKRFEDVAEVSIARIMEPTSYKILQDQLLRYHGSKTSSSTAEKPLLAQDFLVQFIKENGDIVTRSMTIREDEVSDDRLKAVLAYVRKTTKRTGLLAFNSQGVLTEANIDALSMLGLYLEGDPTNQPMLVAAGLRLEDIIAPSFRAHIESMLDHYKNGSVRRKLHPKLMLAEVHVWQLWHKDGFAVPCFVRHWVGLGNTGQVQHRIQFEAILSSVPEFMTLTLRLGQDLHVADAQGDPLLSSGMFNVQLAEVEGKEIKDVLSENVLSKLLLKPMNDEMSMGNMSKEQSRDLQIEPSEAARENDNGMDSLKIESKDDVNVPVRIQEASKDGIGRSNGELSSDDESIDAFSRRASRDELHGHLQHLLLPVKIFNGKRLLSRLTVRPGPLPVVRIQPIEGLEGSFRISDDNTIASWSPEAELITGISEADAVGIQVEKLFPNHTPKSRVQTQKKESSGLTVGECIRVLSSFNTDVTLDRQKAFSLTFIQVVSFGSQLLKCRFHVTLCDDSSLSRVIVNDDEQRSIGYHIAFSCVTHGSRSETVTGSTNNWRKLVRRWKLSSMSRNDKTDSLLLSEPVAPENNGLGTNLNAIRESDEFAAEDVDSLQRKEGETEELDDQNEKDEFLYEEETAPAALLLPPDVTLDKLQDGKAGVPPLSAPPKLQRRTESQKSVISRSSNDQYAMENSDGEGNAAQSEDSHSVSISGTSSKEGVVAKRLSRMRKVSKMLNKYSIRESVRRFKSFIIVALVILAAMSAAGLAITTVGFQMYVQSMQRMQDVERIVQDSVAVASLALGVQRSFEKETENDQIWSSAQWPFGRPPLADRPASFLLEDIADKGKKMSQRIVTFSKFAQIAMDRNSSFRRALYDEPHNVISVLDYETGLRGVQTLAVVQVILNFAAASQSFARENISEISYAQSENWYFIQDNWQTLSQLVGRVLEGADEILKGTLYDLQRDEIVLLGLQLAILGIIFYLLISIAGKALVRARMRLLNVFLRLPISSIRVVIEALSISLDTHNSDGSEAEDEGKVNVGKNMEKNDTVAATGIAETVQENENETYRSEGIMPLKRKYPPRKSVEFTDSSHALSKEAHRMYRRSDLLDSNNREDSGSGAIDSPLPTEQETYNAKTAAAKYQPTKYPDNSDTDGLPDAKLYGETIAQMKGDIFRPVDSKRGTFTNGSHNKEGSQSGAKLEHEQKKARRMSMGTTALTVAAFVKPQKTGQVRGRLTNMGVSVFKYVVPLSVWGLLHLATVAFNLDQINIMTMRSSRILKSSERVSLTTRAMLHANHYVSLYQPHPLTAYDSIYGTVGQRLKREFPDEYQAPDLHEGDTFVFNGTREDVKRMGRTVASVQTRESVMKLLDLIVDIEEHTQGFFVGSTLQSDVHDILYSTGTCHIVEEEKLHLCPNESSPAFPELTQGLDMLLTRYLNLLKVIVTDSEPLSAVNLKRLHKAVTLYYPHVEGGMKRLSQRIFAEFRASEGIMSSLHIVTFVITVVGLFLFYIITVRPFLADLEKEGARSIALLVSLPEKAHIEKILGETSAALPPNQLRGKNNKVSPALL